MMQPARLAATAAELVGVLAAQRPAMGRGLSVCGRNHAAAAVAASRVQARPAMARRRRMATAARRGHLLPMVAPGAAVALVMRADISVPAAVTVATATPQRLEAMGKVLAPAVAGLPRDPQGQQGRAATGLADSLFSGGSNELAPRLYATGAIA